MEEKIMDYELLEVEKYDSERGTILNVLRGDTLKEQNFGQIYVINVLPGQTRGKHYHKEKEEWIVMLSGTLEIRMKDIVTGETETILLEASYENPKKLRISPKVAHSFTNRGETVVEFLEYSSRMYDPVNEDVYKSGA